MSSYRAADGRGSDQPDRSLVVRAGLVGLGVAVVAVFSVLELDVLSGYREAFGHVIDGQVTATAVAGEVRELSIIEANLMVYGGAAWVLTGVAVLFLVLAVRRRAGDSSAVPALLRNVFANPTSRALAIIWALALLAGVVSEAVGDQLMRTAEQPTAFVDGLSWSMVGNTLILVAAVLGIGLLARLVRGLRR